LKVTGSDTTSVLRLFPPNDAADGRRGGVIPAVAQLKGPDGLIGTEAIAAAYWYLHTQHRSAWSQEIDLRSYSESF
jgi:hypothetical protein